MNNITQIHDSKNEFTIQEFADYMKVSYMGVQKMLQRNSLPDGFKTFKPSPGKRVILREQVEEEQKPEYINPSKLPPQTIVAITRCLSDKNFYKPNGQPNKRKIADHCKVHYDTLVRYLRGDYKSPDQSRSDKGKSRRLSKAELKEAKKHFTVLLLANVQRNVKLTMEKVFKNTGIEIPQRKAYKWAKELSGAHLQSED